MTAVLVIRKLCDLPTPPVSKEGEGELFIPQLGLPPNGAPSPLVSWSVNAGVHLLHSIEVF